MRRAKQVFNNIGFAFIAQFFSLILSLLLSLWLPKFLTIDEYGYWQLFLFYSSYTGILHLGLADGIYLKYGGIDYEKLDYKLFKEVFIALSLIQIVFSLMILLFGFFWFTEKRLLVVLFVSFYSIIYNLNNFFNLLFQATGKIRFFSKSCIIRSFSITLFLGILLSNDVYLFQYYVLIFIAGHSVALLYNICKCRELLLCVGWVDKRLVLCEIATDISIGINLMIANVTGMLIIGVGRFLIDRIWGISTFAVVSLSLSLVNFVLLFVNQIGIVFFPLLRQSTDKQLKNMYVYGNTFLSIVMPTCLFLYYPTCLVVRYWLPQYVESLKFFALLVPICLFDGKMQMLYSTYLKVLRKERFLFKVNFYHFLLSVVLCTVSGYILNNMYVLLMSIVCVIILRSLSVNYWLRIKMDISDSNILLFEIVLIVLFVFTAWYFSLKWSFAIYFFCYIAYLMLCRKSIYKIVLLIRR